MGYKIKKYLEVSWNDEKSMLASTNTVQQALGAAFQTDVRVVELSPKLIKRDENVSCPIKSPEQKTVKRGNLLDTLYDEMGEHALKWWKAKGMEICIKDWRNGQI